MKPAEFPAAVEQTARRFGMDLSRPLAMVSGGPDSVALLRALVELGTQPVVLHVDHNLRGEEARFDAEFVRRLCEEFGLDGEVRRVELGESNLQDEARKERYRVAEALAKSGDNSSITTGHTADDVAETVLMNLARGAGLRGLSGIPPVRGKIARPLIERRRREILSYLEHLGQPYRTDLSNLTPKYARNRVRLEVLPVLEELYPGAARNISRAASLLREDSAALEELAARSTHRRGEEVVVSLGELSLPALGSYAVRRAYQNLRPDAPPLGFTVVEAVLRLTKTGEGTRTLDLPGNVVVAARSPKELAFYQKVEPFEGEEDLIVGEFGFAGWLVSVREVSKLDIQDAGQPEVAYLDAALGPYRVRMAREGDTIRPLGLGGTKKIHKAMMDRGVPKDIRPRTPVIVDRRGRVAWIFAGELDEEFKIRAGTKKALRVKVESSSLP